MSTKIWILIMSQEVEGGYLPDDRTIIGVYNSKKLAEYMNYHSPTNRSIGYTVEEYQLETPRDCLDNSREALEKFPQ